MSPDIRLQRWFEAPPEVVFDAYTDPDAQRALRAGGPPDWVVDQPEPLSTKGARPMLRTLVLAGQSEALSGEVTRPIRVRG
jgi:hypothetical protein